MTRLVWTFLALAFGALAGLGLTALAVSNPPNFGTVDSGAWVSRPRIGAADGDPYSRALLAVRGELPLGAAEGVALTADLDSAGEALNARCTYRVSGPLPLSRYWTLTAYQPDGAPAGTASQRYAFSSGEIIRDVQGTASIMLSPEPQSGNWLPLPGSGSFGLILRLYDTQISGNARALDGAGLPQIVRISCL